MPEVAGCSGVTVRYRSAGETVIALDNVDASFPEGGLHAVAGPSGSGKSTLLRCLAGLERPQAGTVRALGGDLTSLSERRRRRLRRRLLGYVVAEPERNLLPQLAADEQIRFAGAVRGRSVDPAPLLAAVGLAGRARIPPAALSGGEQQRLALAAAVAGDPALVFVDEPTAELDRASAAEVLAAISALRERGSTFLVATHDGAVLDVADSVLRLSHGRVETEAAGAAATGRRARVAARRAGNGEVLLRCDHLVRRFGSGRQQATVAIDALEVRAGELVGLAGPSGSGKTTVLNLLYGWERPDEGSVETFAGRDPARLDWAAVALLPQTLGLLDELTIEENARLPATLGGRDADPSPLFESLGLVELARRRPGELSLGQRQRSALARALVLAPRVLLADEPTAHQDDGWTRAILDVLRAHTSNGNACLVATHAPLVLERCDRIVSLSSVHAGG